MASNGRNYVYLGNMKLPAECKVTRSILLSIVGKLSFDEIDPSLIQAIFEEASRKVYIHTKLEELAGRIGMLLEGEPGEPKQINCRVCLQSECTVRQP